MSKKFISLGLIIIGVVVLVVSLSADYIGLGSSTASIGWKQLLGAGIGFIVALVGIGLALRRSKTEK
jgi:hypothetical protein